MVNDRILLAALAVICIVIAACTFLVYTDDVPGNDFMLVVVGPIVGGLIGFVAGTKGVQQGSQASSAPPPDA